MTRLIDYPASTAVPHLTLDSPHNRNALSTALVTQLHQGLRDAAADPDCVAGRLGHRRDAFCAGADLSEAGGGSTRPGGYGRRGRDDHAAAGHRWNVHCPSSVPSTGTSARAVWVWWGVRHRRGGAAQHILADRGPHRGCSVDHLP